MVRTPREQFDKIKGQDWYHPVTPYQATNTQVISIREGIRSLSPEGFCIN